MISGTLYRKLEKLPEDLKDALLDLIDELGKTVTKEDFRELKETVQELAEAQKKTKEKINQLVEAQKTTEQRVTKLETVVQELAEAQRETERKLNELAEAQRETEKSLKELAKAQKETESKVALLFQEHKKTREQVGNLINLHGFLLEDRAYKGLPQLLKRDFNATVIEPFKRTFVSIERGKEIELNIVGKVEIKGEEFWVLGECKTQLKRSHISEFERKIEQLKKIFGDKIIKILVTAQTINSKVIKIAEQRGFKLYFSYEF